MNLRLIDADEIAALGYPGAVTALEQALQAGLDPAAGLDRVVVELAAGQLLLMPAQSVAVTGVKVVSVVPGNAARGLPGVHASYLLFDAATMTPRAYLDGTALTTLRTPAVSMAATRSVVQQRTAALEVVVFGAGAQGLGHAQALRSVAAVASVTHVVRDPSRVRTADRVLAQADPATGTALARADVVVCATTAREALFDSRLLRGDVCVIAIGSYEPTARELDPALLSRAQVVVEDPATALREAGTVVLAIGEGALTAADLVPMADVVRGVRQLDPSRATVFVGTGMAWQDLVVAAAVMDMDAAASR